MTRPILIHIRHGETDWNAARRLQGSLDIPLNATGRAQAARNGERLKQLLAEWGLSEADFTWIASPLGRARETMQIVRGKLELDPAAYSVEPRLIELSFGRFEGSTYEEMEAREPESYASLRADKWHFVPPGGESYVVLTERVEAALAALTGNVIIVSHGGVFRAILGLLRHQSDQALADMLVPQDRFFVHRDGEEAWV